MKPIKITCGECERWRSAKERDVEKEGKIIISNRKCIITEKIITSNTPINGCEYFILAKYIFCEKEDNWIKPEVCLHRKKMKNPLCYRCKYHKVISSCNTISINHDKSVKEIKFKRRCNNAGK